MSGIRELSIVYGTLTINEANSRYIDGKYTVNKKFDKTIVTFNFVITKTTEDLFGTEVSAIEAEFRKPYQDFSISQGSKTLISLKPSANTGLNTKATITKVADSVADTGRSRRYMVTIEADMPADGQSPLPDGLRESTIDVRYSPSGRRTVTISGVVTALTTNASRAEYTSIITTYATTILSALGGTYKLAEKPREENDGTDKLLSFTHIYDEIIFNQGGTIDDADLSRQQLSMNLVRNYPGDTPEVTVNRMVTVSINYEVWVAKGKDIKTKWENNIKPWLVTTVRSTFNLSMVALIDENVGLLKDDNRITANLTLRGAQINSAIIEEQITYSFEDTSGIILVPVWSGNSLQKYAYQGPATKKLTINITAKVMGSQIMKVSETLARANKYLTGNNIILVSSKRDSRPIIVGKAPDTHTITEILWTDVYEAYRGGNRYLFTP